MLTSRGFWKISYRISTPQLQKSDKEFFKLLDRRVKAKLQWLQNPAMHMHCADLEVSVL
jgi:hypothetical protein